MELTDLTFIEDHNFIKIKHNNDLVLIKTSLLRVPFGFKELTYNDKINYSFQISIDKSFNEKSYELLTFVKDIESYIINKYKDNSLIKDKTFISRIYIGKNYPLIQIDLKNNTFISLNEKKLENIKLYKDKSFLAYTSFIVTGIFIGKTNYGLSFKCEDINIKDKTFKILDFS